MVNEDYEPTDREDEIIDVLRQERRVNPYLLREETGFGKGDVNTALSNLTSAGWVRRVTRGLYEYVDDPRTNEDTHTNAQAAAKGKPADVSEVLDGWSHGRGEREREASADVARAGLEWLRDRAPDTARRADVPLDELRERDPMDRSKETIWTEVVRPSWSYAADRGYVEQPDSRNYRWNPEKEGFDG